MDSFEGGRIWRPDPIFSRFCRYLFTIYEGIHVQRYIARIDIFWQPNFLTIIFTSGRPNRSGLGSGSAELTGSVRFGGSAEPEPNQNTT